MQRMRILHVFSTFDVGGPQVRMARMIARWSERGEPVEHLICAHDGKYGARALLPADARVTGAQDMPLRQSRTMRRLRRLGSCLRAAPVDLICTHSWGRIDVVMANRLLAGRPLVHHEEGFEVAEASRQK